VTRRGKVPRELKKIETLFDALMAQPVLIFPLVGETLEATVGQGVYVILDRKNRPVHVGRMLRGKKGIAQRLHNHLRAQSSFTVQYLKGDGSKLRGAYRFRFLEVADSRSRALLEAYAIGHLCPAHIGLGDGPS
jgi:hypothetical protein